MTNDQQQPETHHASSVLESSKPSRGLRKNSVVVGAEQRSAPPTTRPSQIHVQNQKRVVENYANNEGSRDQKWVADNYANENDENRNQKWIVENYTPQQANDGDTLENQDRLVGNHTRDNTTSEERDWLGQVEPLPLEREIRASSVPGAHPGPRFATGRHISNTGEHGNMDEQNMTSELGLVEARQVELPSGVAQLVDPETLAQQGNFKRKKERYICWCLIIVLICATLTVALAVTFSRKDEDRESSAPSLSPSTSTSPAPEATTEKDYQMDLLFNDLPDSSKESMRDPFSPQSLAWAWLLKHRDLTQLPVWRKKQLFALGTIYYSYNGTNWPLGLDKAWLDDTKSECDWYSGLHGAFGGDGDYTNRESTITSVCDAEGRFQRLMMSHGQFFGLSIHNVRMPPEIALLNLKEIELGFNGFQGISMSDVMTPDFFNLSSSLEKIRFYHDNMNGEIPSEIGLLRSLRGLELQNLHLRGTIPTEIGLLTRLNEELIVACNPANGAGLIGPIPSQLGRLSHLHYLELRGCKLSSSIPTEIGRMTSLKRLRLERNMLSGAIPTELQALTNLEDVNLAENALSGTLPPQGFANLTNLELVQMNGNPLLSGTIPLALCQLNLSLSVANCSYYFWQIPSNVVPVDQGDPSTPCEMKLDCTDLLCGCDCPCGLESNNNNQTDNVTTIIDP